MAFCLPELQGTRSACNPPGPYWQLVQWHENTMKTKALGVRSMEMTEKWANWRPVPGHSPPSHAPWYVRYRILCSLLGLLIVAVGCGSGSGFNPNNVTVSVAPATATLSVNGQVSLQATESGLCSGCLSSIDFWTVTENPSGSDCATYVGIQPPGPCPAGTIQIADGSELTVTYIAPSTPGTYHVNGEWEDFVNFSGPPVATKTGTSVITVSP
jgi:hypothetical protein